jgi:predicted phage terminase large subunit-like protein
VSACTHTTLRSANANVCPICPPKDLPAYVSDLAGVPRTLETGIYDSADIVTALTDLERQLCNASLYDFVRLSWSSVHGGTEFEDGWHIEAICLHVQAQIDDAAKARDPLSKYPYKHRAQDLVINVPPRCLKTHIVSVCAVAWCWLRYPWYKILTLSVNPRTAQNAADDTRRLITSVWYQTTFRPSWQLREDRHAIANLGNTAGGIRASRGLDSSVIGEGFDWIILDDPDDGDAVYSENARTTTRDNITRAIYNRINHPEASHRTLVQQRLHVGDTSALFLELGAGALVLPAVLEVTPKPTHIGWRDPRQIGESLHARLSTDFVAIERKRLGSIDWAAQLQQRPESLEGGLIRREWWRRYDDPPVCERVVISVDAAFKGTGTSRVSVQVWGAKGPDRFLLDNVTDKVDFGQTCATIRALRTKWPKCVKVLIEDKANGPAIISVLSKEMSGVVGCNPQGGKESRLQAIAPQIESGNVYLPRYAPWLDDFIAECSQFPHGVYDDQVDAMSQVLLDLRTGGTIWASVVF